MSNDYVYIAEAVTLDGQSHILDLEEYGWADKELLGRTVRWSIVPKELSSDWKIIVVHIPEGGKPIFKSRVYGNTRGISFRCYAVGFKKGKTSYWVWSLPNGAVEVGDEPYLPDFLLRKR